MDKVPTKLKRISNFNLNAVDKNVVMKLKPSIDKGDVFPISGISSVLNNE